MQVDTVDGQMDANQPPPTQSRGDIVSETALLVQRVRQLNPSSRQVQLEAHVHQLLQEVQRQQNLLGYVEQAAADQFLQQRS